MQYLYDLMLIIIYICGIVIGLCSPQGLFLFVIIVCVAFLLLVHFKRCVCGPHSCECSLSFVTLSSLLNGWQHGRMWIALYIFLFFLKFVKVLGLTVGIPFSVNIYLKEYKEKF